MHAPGLEVHLVGAEATAGVAPHAVRLVAEAEVQLEAHVQGQGAVEDRGRVADEGAHALLGGPRGLAGAGGGAVGAAQQAHHLAVGAREGGDDIGEAVAELDDAQEVEAVVAGVEDDGAVVVAGLGRGGGEGGGQERDHGALRT